MKQKIAAGILFLCLVAALSGCGRQGTETPTEESKVISCAEVIAQIDDVMQETHCDTSIYYGEETYTEYFDYLYDFPLEDVEDGAFCYASASYADEVTLIRVSDAAAAAELEKKLEKRVTRRQTDFKGYKPEEVTKLGQAQTAVCGNYVMMAVCDHADEVVKAMKALLEGEQ